MKVTMPSSAVCGLYALHFLADRQRPARAAEVARACGAPARFVSGILKRLREQGFVRSAPGGGYLLARPAGTISLFEVMKAFGASEGERPCSIDYDQCPERGGCPLSPFCREVHWNLVASLKSFSVTDLGPEHQTLPLCCGTPDDEKQAAEHRA
jgi:Rrf2 family protein